MRVNGLRVGLLGVLCALVGVVALPGAGASADSCPNAQFRTGLSAALPDCRAYEQVSPVFKDGFRDTLVSLGAGGARLKSESLGMFAGSTAVCLTSNYYDLTRTAGGWAATSLMDAPVTEFAYAGNHCSPVLSNDQGAALLELHPASQSIYGRDLYLRRPDGSFALVGPMVPPAAVPPTPTGTGAFVQGRSFEEFVGANRDFSHVLFELASSRTSSNFELPPGVETQLWPGDTTLNDEAEPSASLYEYIGTDNSAPVLVGVDNGGRLLSDCGTFLGGSGYGNTKLNGVEGNKYNAISTDGSQVLFTALGADNSICTGGGTMPPVDEIFARVGGVSYAGDI
jgi:hypothetical protein